MSRLKKNSAGVVLLGLAIAQLVPDARAETWKDRLQNEAPIAWAKLEEFYSHLECAWIERIENTQGRGKGTMEDLHKTLLIDGPLRRVHGDRQGTDRRGVMAVNKRYAFHIQRESESKAYQVVKYYRKKDASSLLDDLHNEFAEIVPAPYSLLAKSLGGWLKNPNLVTEEVVAAPEGPPGLVRWKARFRPARPSAKEPPPFTVTLFLDSKRHWCVQKYEILTTYENGAQVRDAAALEYGQTVDGFPVISRVSRTVTNLADGRAQQRTAVMQSFATKTDIPEEEFTLTAFGVPELEEWPSDRGHLWYWILGFALAAVAFALWLRFHGRKTANATAG